MLGGRSLYGGAGRFAVPGTQRGPTVPPQRPVLHSRRPALAGQDRSGNAERHRQGADAGQSRPFRKDTALRDIQTIIMGNGTAEVQAPADYVTDTVDGDGVAKALRHFGVI